ncbi:TPA: hypothetical protein ACHD73_000585 [Campylobacter jejuni]|uniref:hypothetical protein n=1 Tax=Campylobacter jejuni TaxID=197 RepID=UPI002042CC82|nr:hypothetical protein [Campylobacter jejuni]
MKIVLLGSCESRWNYIFFQTFKKRGIDIKTLSFGAMHPYGHIYNFYRKKNHTFFSSADLFIYTIDSAIFSKNNEVKKEYLYAYDCICKILSSLNCKVLMIQWHHYVHVSGDYTPFCKIQSEKYGFNFIDAYQFCLKEGLLDFFTSFSNYAHPMDFVYSKMAENIIKNLEVLKSQKPVSIPKLPNFKVLDLDEIENKNDNNFVIARTYLYREKVYKIDNIKEINFSENDLNMKIIGIHTWNDAFLSVGYHSCCILENNKQKVAFTSYSGETFRKIDFNFIVNKTIKIHHFFDKNTKKSRFDYYNSRYENNKKSGIIGFLLVSKEEKMEDVEIPKEIEFEISKEYDFTHLCEYLKEYKIIIEQYNQRRDPAKLQPLQDQISNLSNEKQNLLNEKNNLENKLNSIPIKKQHLELANLEQDLIIKKLESKKLAKSLGIKMDIINPKVTFIQANSAKARIQNQLSYKLGQAMIENSKSILGYIRMPYVLSYIKDKYKQEKIKKDPSLKLPPLESYPDYKEALKFKEHLSYKLGEALIKASRNWYKGGYLKLFFEIRKLKKEFKNKEI